MTIIAFKIFIFFRFIVFGHTCHHQIHFIYKNFSQHIFCNLEKFSLVFYAILFQMTVNLSFKFMPVLRKYHILHHKGRWDACCLHRSFNVVLPRPTNFQYVIVMRWIGHDVNTLVFRVVHYTNYVINN